MSETKTKPPRRASGEHPSVRGFREKMDSLDEGALTELQSINARLEALKKRSDRPAADPQREDDSEVPVDVVEQPETDPAKKGK